jgi:Sec-independent protein secretion pathway component TatC
MPASPQDTDDPPAPGEPGGVMSFGDHLEELRRRIILALAVPLPLALGLFIVSSSIREILTAPLYAALEARRLPTQVQALSPVETITTDLFLSIVFALVLSAPWLLYQLWRFVEPGLYAHERRFARFLFPASGVLTLAGLAMLYWVMLPLMLLFLVGFGQHGPRETFPQSPAAAATETAGPAEALPSEAADATTAPPPATNLATLPVLETPPKTLRPGDAWIDAATAQLQVAVPAGPDRLEIRSVALARDRSVMPIFRLREYVDFVLLLSLAVSIAFQMPLVILLLGWAGIVETPGLRRNRRYALLACAVVAAVLTPPDFISMFLLLGPLYGLYELGILLLVALPPHRIGRGSVVRDAVDRFRHWRRRGRTAPDASAPPPRGSVPRGRSGDEGDEGGEAWP